MRLHDKIALLTDAAAAIKGELMGFGGAAAHLFVREGAKVVLTDIRDDLGERAAASLRAEGHDARYLHLDVTSEQNWVQVVDAVMAAHGRLDILFNNAGVSFPGKVEDITVEIWERELGVHAKGVFLGTRTAIPASSNRPMSEPRSSALALSVRTRTATPLRCVSRTASARWSSVMVKTQISTDLRALRRSRTIARRHSSPGLK